MATRATRAADPDGSARAFHFFAGKGGVGKTTCAAAAAVAAAASGARVLVVSTDPAHSIGDALMAGGSRRAVWRVGPRLHAAELDADTALTRWIAERRQALRGIVGRGTYLDDDDIDAVLRLAFPGVDELIGLIELERLARGGPWDHVVVDTAPTGHTLRLLAMPATLSRIATVLDDMQAKHRFLAESLGGRYRPDATDALVDEIAAAGRDLATLLRDPARVRISWVLLPETLSVAEARDGVGALEDSGLAVAELIVNRVTPPPPEPCALCDGRRVAEAAVLEEVRASFPHPIRAVPALEREPRGVAALRALAGRMAEVDAMETAPLR
ncbi:MAG: ArsA family ATPase, partial [Candidatus Rokubacteria bacterium]|nr:ArsA family ATPase [Candidatus Rokubacteria bacterium]